MGNASTVHTVFAEKANGMFFGYPVYGGSQMENDMQGMHLFTTAAIIF